MDAFNDNEAPPKYEEIFKEMTSYKKMSSSVKRRASCSSIHHHYAHHHKHHDQHQSQKRRPVLSKEEALEILNGLSTKNGWKHFPIDSLAVEKVKSSFVRRLKHVTYLEEQNVLDVKKPIPLSYQKVYTKKHHQNQRDTDNDSQKTSTVLEENIQICEHCEGKGFKDCSKCKGAATVTCWNCEGLGVESFHCTNKSGTCCCICSGSGRTSCGKCNLLSRKECKECSGKGKILNTKVLETFVHKKIKMEYECEELILVPRNILDKCIGIKHGIPKRSSGSNLSHDDRQSIRIEDIPVHEVTLSCHFTIFKYWIIGVENSVYFPDASMIKKPSSSCVIC